MKLARSLQLCALAERKLFPKHPVAVRNLERHVPIVSVKRRRSARPGTGELATASGRFSSIAPGGTNFVSTWTSSARLFRATLGESLIEGPRHRSSTVSRRAARP